MIMTNFPILIETEEWVHMGCTIFLDKPLSTHVNHPEARPLSVMISGEKKNTLGRGHVFRVCNS